MFLPNEQLTWKSVYSPKIFKIFKLINKISVLQKDTCGRLLDCMTKCVHSDELLDCMTKYVHSDELCVLQEDTCENCWIYKDRIFQN